MSPKQLNLVARYQQPEYTGENRCIPCTIVNVVIATVVSGFLALVSLVAGVSLFLASLLVIYLRGYLVPGTPTLTQRYLPASVLARFEKGPDTDAYSPDVGGRDTRSDESFDIERELVAAGIVEPCESDGLCLTDAFEREWWNRIEQFYDRGAAVERLGAVLNVDAEGLAFDDSDGRFDVRFEDARIGGWASEAAFLADLAVEPTLDDWLPEWSALESQTRTQLLAGMRVFLDECPRCKAALDPVEDTINTCCSNNMTTVSIDCHECGDRVFNGRYR